MNPIRNPFSLNGARFLAGVLALLVAGCSTPSNPSQKVYDRYAELLAKRNREMTGPAAEQAPEKKKTAARSSAAKIRKKPASTPKPTSTVSNRRPIFPEPEPQPSSPPVKPAPEPAVKPAPEPAAKPAPKPVAVPKTAEPEPVPPVQIMAPRPAPMPAEVAAVPPAAVPAPSAPAAPAPADLPPSHNPLLADGNVYKLKVGDMVQVFLRGIPAAEAIEGIIDEHGMISLPFINEVKAAGHSASELSRIIRQTYLEQGIYKNISVGVVVPTRYFFIQGEVRGPGRYQIVSATRVSQAIASAGGYTDYASGQVLVRRGGKVFKRIRNARRLERTPQDDILLEPDDIIEVKRSLW